MMKKLTAALLTLALLFTAGCSGSGKPNKETGNIIARHSAEEEGVYYGELGDMMRNEFFDFIVEDVELTDTFGGYTAKEGMRLLCVTVKETNTFDDALPMFDTDFVLTWETTESLIYPLVNLNDKDVMPEEFELAKGKSVTYKLVFEVPSEESEFLFIYLEEFDTEETGDFFVVTLRPEVQ